MNYLTHEVTFALPGLDVDRTVNVLTLTDPERGTAFQLIVNRDVLLAGETLEQCCKRQMGLLTRQAQSFKLASQRVGRLGPTGIEAIGLESSFSQAGKTYHQLQAMFAIEPPKLMVITLSSHVPIHAGHREVWNRVLNSLKPREDGPDAPPDAATPPPADPGPDTGASV